MISLQPLRILSCSKILVQLFPPMCVAGGAVAHVSSSNLTLPVISNEALHLPSNSAPPELATQQLSNSASKESFVGMSFNTSDAVKDYYNSYARHTSFSIRINTSRESKKANEKTKYIYVCQKAGVNKKEKVAHDGPISEKKIVRQRRRDYVDRTHCLAHMIMRKTSPGH
ncbi:hypothetical protein PVAP13_9NG313014 [Panicum virgatum]|uniref:FAR1 domain-containing protein n=1 Tax=Panicum virgatum TaxID=38727 RepID=A0A8T0MTU4_PANVG|nr:hypothetical protein PVAP13_9NG313014 [Panicum virgatum]